MVRKNKKVRFNFPVKGSEDCINKITDCPKELPPELKNYVFIEPQISHQKESHEEHEPIYRNDKGHFSGDTCSERKGSESINYDEEKEIEDSESINDISTVVYQVSSSDICKILGPADLLKFEVTIEGSRFKAIIDSGAQFGMVDSEVLKKLNIEYNENEKNVVRGVGERNIFRTMGTVSLKVGIHGVEFSPVMFHVINSKYPVILGSNFLIENKININLKENVITKTFEDGTFQQLYLNDNKCKKFFYRMPCYLMKDETLKEQNLRMIKARISHPEIIEQIRSCGSCKEGSGLEIMFEGISLTEDVKTWSGIVNVRNEIDILVSKSVLVVPQ